MRAFVLALALVACGPPPEPENEPPPPPESVGTKPDCELMCTQLAKLKCDFLTADCVDACFNVESSGITTVCPRQVAQATDCDDAKRRSRCDE